MKKASRWGIAAAIVIAGFCVGDGIRSIHGPATVSVKGQAEQGVVADVGSWNLTFQNTRPLQAEAIRQSLADRETVLKYLGSVGFTAEEMTVGAPRVENQSYQGRDQWMVSSSVMLSSTAEKIRKVSGEADRLLKLGVALSSWDAPTYEFTKLNDIKADLVSRATQEARKAAEQFAKDSGTRVGAIQGANQGYVSFRGRIENQPETNQIQKVARVVVNATYALK